MALKLLVFGLPGSGKSTIAHCISAYLQGRKWESVHFSDHVILEEMFLTDLEHKQFEPAAHGGFDVIDFVVCDIALQKLEFIVKMHLLYAKQEEMVLVEFARNDYMWAFQQFSDRFLNDAYFLYLDVDSETCKKRIDERTAHPRSANDFYVSGHIFDTYYRKDDARSIEQILIELYGIDKQRVKTIDNNGSLSQSMKHIYQFVHTICGFESL